MRTLLTLIGTVGLVLLATGGPVRASESAGRKVFLERKCHNCHALESEGILKSKDPDEGTEEEPSDDAPPDLSGVGEQMDAETMDGWLRKKIVIDGDRHPKRFAGSDAERKVLIEWLRQTAPRKEPPRK